jgi:hypothetical protein
MSKPLPEELLSAYLDGELSPQESESVREQLSEKVNADKLANLRQLQNRLRDLPNFKLDADFTDKVLAKVDELSLKDISLDGSLMTRESMAGTVSLPTVSLPTASDKSESSFKGHPWRASLATIVALAAMVLLTLFLRPPVDHDVVGRIDPSTAEMEFDSEFSDEVAGKEGKSGSIDSAGTEKSGDADPSFRKKSSPVSENEDSIGRNQNKTRSFKQAEPGSDKLPDQIVEKMADPPTPNLDNVNDGQPRGGRIAKDGVGGGGLGNSPTAGGKKGRWSDLPSDNRNRREPQTPVQVGALVQQVIAPSSPQPIGDSNVSADQIVHVRLNRKDFDNYLVEQTLLKNNIACELPPASNSKRDSDFDKQSKEDLRIILVEAYPQQLNSTLEQLKNVNMNPMLPEQPDTNQYRLLADNQLGRSNKPGNKKEIAGEQKSDGDDGKQELIRLQQQPNNPQQQIAQLNYSNARRYVPPSQLPRADRQRRLQNQIVQSQKYFQIPAPNTKYFKSQTNQQGQTQQKGNVDKKSVGQQPLDLKQKEFQQRFGQQENSTRPKQTEVEKSDKSISPGPSKDEMAEILKIEGFFGLVGPPNERRRMLFVIQADSEAAPLSLKANVKPDADSSNSIQKQIDSGKKDGSKKPPIKK